MIKKWVMWKMRQDKAEIKRATGHKKYGIEHRLAVEAGVVVEESRGYPEEYPEVDEAWRILKKHKSDHMDAVFLFYLLGSYRKVRLHKGWSQHKTKCLVDDGELLLRGAVIIIMDKITHVDIK